MEKQEKKKLPISATALVVGMSVVLCLVTMGINFKIAINQMFPGTF